MIYCGFADAQDVAKQFAVDLADLGTIYLAIYDTPSYEGYAFVLTEIGGKLYEVNGSHCSCNGLEEQWEPEETDPKALMYRMTEGRLGAIGDTNYTKEIQEALETWHKHSLVFGLAGVRG